MNEIRYVAATGALGVGVDAEALNQSLDFRPHFIASDAGTTDAGPFALGSGTAAFPREAVKRDLARVLVASSKAKIPALIGSAGTAGGDPHVDWVLGIAREIAEENGLSLRTAVIRSEQNPDYLLGLYREARIRALDPAPAIDETVFARSTRIVGMMGVEPLQAALDAGADFVLAGRCSDPALFAALPILRGLPPGLAWHAGKVTECGTMACEGGHGGVITATVREHEVILRPVGEGLRCTPQSIAAHSLYENAHPYLHKECSGTLDLTQSKYTAIDAASVRITLHPAAAGPVAGRGQGLYLRIGGASTFAASRGLDPQRPCLWPKCGDGCPGTERIRNAARSRDRRGSHCSHAGSCDESRSACPSTVPASRRARMDQRHDQFRVPT